MPKGLAVLLAAAVMLFTGATVSGPDPGNRVRYVSISGSDTADGLSWDSPYRTIGHALDALSATRDPGGDVWIGSGIFAETVTIRQPLVHLHGVHADPGLAQGTRIQPPTDTADGIDILASQVAVDDIAVGAARTSWNGMAVSIQGSQNMLRDVVLRNPDNSATATSGGVGLFIQSGEANLIERFNCSEYSLCLQLGLPTTDVADDNVFIDLALSRNYRDLYLAGRNGGNKFYHLKAVAGKCSVANLVEIQSSNNLFSGLDADEGCDPNALLVSGGDNLFEVSTDAPESNLRVTGDRNHFINYSVLHNVTVTGTGNTFDTPWVPYHLGLVDQGTGTIVINPFCRLVDSCVYNATTRHPVYQTGVVN